MEAVRPVEQPPPSFEQQQDPPPPPAPFPTDLLQNDIGSSSPSVDQADMTRSLQSVQRSVAQALSAFLPDELAPGQGSPSQRNGNGEFHRLGEESQLASALMELLEVTYELEGLVPPPIISTEEPTELSDDTQTLPPNDLASSLKHLQHARSTSLTLNQLSSDSPTTPRPTDFHPSVEEVRRELAWARMESLSNVVLEVVKQGAEGRGGLVEGLPPRYERHESDVGLPSYSDIPPTSTQSADSALKAPDSKPRASLDTIASERPTAQREKMLSELEAVTLAIERLYDAAPRFQNQRVEIRPRAARRTSETMNGAQARELGPEDSEKLKRVKRKELDEIWMLMNGGRYEVMEDQRAGTDGLSARSKERFITRIVEQSEASRLTGQDSKMRSVDAELARARDLKAKDIFLRDLVEQSAGGRMNNQDADAPLSDLTSASPARKQALLSTLISHTATTRLKSQDYPTTLEDRLTQKHEQLVDTLLQVGSRRLPDQDSLPPTPRGARNEESETDPFEEVSVTDFLNSSRPPSPPSKSSEKEKGDKMLRERSNSEGGGKSKLVSKIGGAVRRGSVHLGLKSAPSFDVNSISYVAEHQENLRSVQIILQGSGLSNLDLTLGTAFTDQDQSTTQAIATSERDPSVNFPITLPVPVHTGQSVQVVQQGLSWECKLAAVALPPAAQSLTIAHALSAPDFRRIKPSLLTCTACERPLSSLPSPYSATLEQSYKDLPSQHWAEMIDIWMCHDDPTFTGRLAGMVEEGFWPKEGGVLCGGSWVLVEECRGRWENLKADEGNENDPWRPIACKCGEVVGKQRSDDGKPGAGTLRLSKWAVGLLRDDVDAEDDAANPPLIRAPLSVFVVSDMLELAQAHASYRFIISDEETQSKRMYIWLFNSSTSISYCKGHQPAGPALPLPSPLRSSFKPNGGSERRSLKSRRSSLASVTAKAEGSGGDERRSRVLKAVKVMFKSAEEVIDGQPPLPGFAGTNQIEHLAYPAEVCTRLEMILKESNKVYPAMKRGMGGFDVGFLERV
ncbi:hypothetical protein I350_03023 [Cryptococcus amylolentus CBS 6273]|uniref:HECT domain-containing protein n=1 Tax=Cryptococcus amylolentus CBS 6273 TaxID=1296118 RepID=A0A1E3K997_9TREE|nr:hypothetical protein I350_03023 [Cryptococcus amylolentus CBS 6273]